MKLTIKQKAFADYYIELGNATEAYIRAGYKATKREVAEANARKLLGNNSVKKYIDEKMKEMLEYAIPISWYSAYCMTDEGKMENIVDDEYHFIMGDYLDSLSDEISELSSELDEMIYGNE